jgi:hypothetical protein
VATVAAPTTTTTTTTTVATVAAPPAPAGLITTVAAPTAITTLPTASVVGTMAFEVLFTHPLVGSIRCVQFVDPTLIEQVCNPTAIIAFGCQSIGRQETLGARFNIAALGFLPADGKCFPFGVL